MNIDNLDINPELREKAQACNSPEEMLALAKKEGYKLTEEQLESVAGGGWGGGGGSYYECPSCGENIGSADGPAPSRCPNCGMKFANVIPD